MKTLQIIKSLVFGLLAGAFAIILISAQPSSYGIAITPLLLAAGIALVMVAELVDTAPRNKTAYGLLFHVVAAVVLLVYTLTTGMLSGYEYTIFGYHSGASVETVAVSGAAWWFPFGVVIVRAIIEAFICLGKSISNAFDNLSFDMGDF